MTSQKSVADYLWNTNIPEVTKELSDEALREFQFLKRAVNDLEDAFKNRKPREAIAYGWVSNLTEHLTKIINEVGRINGAVLVRGTEKPNIP
jgi:signal transduction histidine kinase